MKDKGRHVDPVRKRCWRCLRRKGKIRLLVWQHGKDKEYAWVQCPYCGGTGYRTKK